MTATTDLETLERDLLARVGAANDEAALEALRVEALGKQGSISALMKNLGSMSPEARKEFGPKLNGLKDRVTEAIVVKKATLAEAALDAQLKAEAVDVTLPPVKPRLGTIHPVSQVMEELAQIFGEMGFSVEEGPDIETDFNNFTALNFPPKHPARETHDTFFMDARDERGDRKVLRTHTSPVQVRTMLKQKPPIRMICMGRTFRKDSDATHTPMFHQIEGLVIDETSTMADLKSVLIAAIKAYFEVDDVKLRFRPHHFPFTEPSAEVDVGCDRSGGQIKIGAGDDWLEILGSGMVHPNVLANCGIDPEKYQGYAFGMGIDRLAMLKYGMNDLRAFFDGDTRWLKHYGFSPYLLPGLAQGLG
ncbi:phenylalanine--tRNA ligase subunit alpha [Vitreimonas flagellata]|uniref:phenylalanine--tRNA ligase subunit alpha n=1 Tax=Vitreimonas flagellata TaxID=2560861 RepID=UPI001074B8D9|nr:phenylalanine--tRNA ligase subunit alpha [Vitreimonas flagellata]